MKPVRTVGLALRSPYVARRARFPFQLRHFGQGLYCLVAGRVVFFHATQSTSQFCYQANLSLALSSSRRYPVPDKVEEVSEQETETRRRKRERSPSFPALDLGTALERAEDLLAREGRHWAPVSAIVDAWGYKPKSSGGLLAIAALKRFGLLEDRGSMEQREGRVTDFAQAIILDEREDSSERRERLQTAALTPRIHREIWDEYGGSLPSDQTLRYNLTVQRGFTQAGANDFIDEFRRTLEFAGLTEGSATVSPQNGDSEPKQTAPPVPQVQRVLPISPVTTSATAPPPIQFPVHGATVILQSTAPLTEAGWDQMMTVLETLKSAIVASAPPAVQDDEAT